MLALNAHVGRSLGEEKRGSQRGAQIGTCVPEVELEGGSVVG